jgi:hypothetical protein
MSAVDVVLLVFRSVEERNPLLAAEVYHDDLEFHWPRPLPYAGSSYRPQGVAGAMAFKLIESAQDRWRAVNAPHLVALVRAGATFVNGKLIERPSEEVHLEAA